MEYLLNFVDCLLHVFQNYETTESRVKREFEAYGPIKRVGIIEHPFWGSGYWLLVGKMCTFMVAWYFLRFSN